ncbi:unnamed protein product [Cyprideis torosa]|uniref:NAD(+) kinase n=1 Tax=Cyprideis torosa TaxID=163714 RepID=A0A7R8WVM7_9CRUS|nr:unnamed protein product [Cyprideis torosa]CAG0909836.1 unnamed protein product [Cyprideis torosa]
MSIQKTLPRAELAERSELIIVVGGDGTLLETARTVAEYRRPMLGINMGRLGFLTDVSPDEISEQLDHVLSGNYYDERRAMLYASISREGKTIAESYALNDVVLHVRDAVRMIEFDTTINGQFVHQQRADGLVVSTPTGSTAYALSSGGPIVHPELDAVLLVPICPHTLSNRPIVVSGDSEIVVRLTPTNRAQAQLSYDGQWNIDLEAEDIITIQKRTHALHLIHPPGYDYYEILRKKLHWSELP